MLQFLGWCNKYWKGGKYWKISKFSIFLKISFDATLRYAEQDSKTYFLEPISKTMKFFCWKLLLP